MKIQQKILIIKIGAIGDVVLALPLLDVFKKASITWVVGKEAAPILKSIDRIDEVIVLDEKKLLEGNFFSKLLELFILWRILLFKRFDEVITAHRDPRYRLLSKTCFKKSHRFFDPKKNKFPIKGEFHSLEYLKLALDKKNDKQKIIWPELRLPDIDHLINGCEKNALIFLSPGGDKKDEGKKLRIWPIEYYVKLAILLQKHKYTIALIGLKQDEWILNYFKDIFFLNLIGKTTLLEGIAVLKQSFGVITHDGGILHLARLAGCKRCGIFGPTSPRDFMLESEDEIVFWGGDGLNCRPCYNGKHFQMCVHQSCMKQIKPGMVLETIKKQWGITECENSNNT